MALKNAYYADLRNYNSLLGTDEAQPLIYLGSC